MKWKYELGNVTKAANDVKAGVVVCTQMTDKVALCPQALKFPSVAWGLKRL